MSEEKSAPNGKAFGRSLLIGLIIAACSAAIGFGVSQMTVAFSMEKTKTEMGFLQQSHLLVRKELENERTLDEKRIENLATLVGKQIDLNKEIIGLVRDVFPNVTSEAKERVKRDEQRDRER